jgi:hypothetical protein
MDLWLSLGTRKRSRQLAEPCPIVLAGDKKEELRDALGSGIDCVCDCLVVGFLAVIVDRD